jgi:hypothetical protein
MESKLGLKAGLGFRGTLKDRIRLADKFDFFDYIASSTFQIGVKVKRGGAVSTPPGMRGIRDGNWETTSSPQVISPDLLWFGRSGQRDPTREAGRWWSRCSTVARRLQAGNLGWPAQKSVINQ